MGRVRREARTLDHLGHMVATRGQSPSDKTCQHQTKLATIRQNLPPSVYLSSRFTPCNGASDGGLPAWANSYDSKAWLLLLFCTTASLSSCLGHWGQTQLTEYIRVATGKTRDQQGRAEHIWVTIDLSTCVLQGYPDYPVGVWFSWWTN